MPRIALRPLAIAAVTVLALAACNKPVVDAKNATPQEVAKQVAASDLKPEAGRWEGTFSIEKMEISGLPPEAAAAMQKATGKANSYASCLTKEEAAKPNAGFFGKDNSGCKYDHFTMAGGKIDAKMVCSRNTGQVTVALSGSYSGTSFDVTSNASGTMPGGHTMNTTAHMKSSRVGECRGDED